MPEYKLVPKEGEFERMIAAVVSGSYRQPVTITNYNTPGGVPTFYVKTKKPLPPQVLLNMRRHGIVIEE